MSLSLATKGIMSQGTVGLATQGIEHQFYSQEEEVVVYPPAVVRPGGGGSGGGVASWTGERVGWWPVGKKPLDAELLSMEESKRLREPEQILFTITRVVLEEETYVFEDGQADPQRLLLGEVDEEYGSNYIGSVPAIEPAPAPQPPQEPPDWFGLITSTVLGFAAGSVAGRIHPALILIVGLGGAGLARKRPWALGGVLIGTSLAVGTLPKKKVTKIAKRKLTPKPTKRKLPPKPKKRIKMKVQRIRVYGKRKT